MTLLPEYIDLTSREEAERLWNGTLDALERAPEDLVALCEALDLGLHAAEVLTIHLLHPVKERFPATIGLQLDLPALEVDPHRDAINVPKGLQFTDIVDLLSAEELECVSPGMHRGWEDRRFSCRRSRVTAQEVIGFRIEADQKEQLLLLAAYRNRLFRYPPPVRVAPGDILPAFDALKRLVAALLAAIEGT